MLQSSFGRLVIALAAFLSLVSSPVLAQSPAAQRGLTFVRVHCAQCHAIDKVSDSPLTIAPPFRTLHLKFPIESLRRRLAEGIVADHPTMPNSGSIRISSRMSWRICRHSSPDATPADSAPPFSRVASSQ